MELGYNRKITGKYGELYKFGEGTYGTYVVSKRIGKRLLKLDGAILRQEGDVEMTISIPEKTYESLRRILKFQKLPVMHRD